MSFKTCKSFWKKAQIILQTISGASQILLMELSLKQSNNDSLFQLLRVGMFKNLQSYLPWYLHVEKEVVALEEDVLVEGSIHIVVKEWATPKGIVILCMAFMTRQPIFPNLKLLNQSSLMKNIRNIWGWIQII